MKIFLLSGIKYILLSLTIFFALLTSLFVTISVATTEVNTENAIDPVGVFQGNKKSDGWRAVRKGIEGRVSIPDKKAGVLIQSDGENWRLIRNGPITLFGIISIIGILILLLIFYLWRGRIAIRGNKGQNEILRFKFFERFAHWLTATSFIILAITGLNILYGKYYLLPILGSDIFSQITYIGKVSHNFIGFSFIFGIILMFFMWLHHNIPNKKDIAWLRMGGGLFSKNIHPPAEKFNAGQKIIFWIVILGGISVSFSGIVLLIPFELKPFGSTFAFFNQLGLSFFPTKLSLIQEMQLAQIWHTIVAIFMIVAIIGHIYIGSLGMEGAFQAMGSGKVDLKWAEEHHSYWVDRVKKKNPEEINKIKG